MPNPRKSASILQRGQIIVVAADTETATRIMELFDRTSKCLATCLQLGDDIRKCPDLEKNQDAIADAMYRFATELVSIYPGGNQQCVADQEIFRNLQIDRKAVM